MKTLELLRTFSKKEMAELDFIIASKKRKPLKQLYAFIRKYRAKNTDPDNKKLFWAAFNKKYTAQKDYLLRNELRLLNKIFRDFLVVVTFNEHTRAEQTIYNLWLTRGLIKRRLDSILLSNIDDFIRLSEQSIYPDETSLLYQMKMRLVMYGSSLSTETINQGLQLLEKSKEYRIKHARYRIRFNEYLQAGLKHNLQTRTNQRFTANDMRTAPQSQINIEPDATDLYERFLILKKYAHETGGILRLEMLKAAAAIAREKAYGQGYSIYPYAELQSLFIDTAVEAIRLKRYKEAEEYYEESIKSALHFNKPYQGQGLIGYASLQLHTCDYQKGIDIIDQYQGNFAAYEQHAKSTRAFYWLFLRRPEEAFKSLPELSELDFHNQVNARYVYLVVFYLRGDMQMAINECGNIYRILKTKQGHYIEDFLYVNSLYRKFLTAVALPKKERETTFAVLSEAIAQHPEKIERMAFEEMPLIWLLKEFEIVRGTKKLPLPV